MCDLIEDLIIGLSSGVISSLAVSIFLNKYWSKKQEIIDFENDKQQYSRFLQHVRTALSISYDTKDYSHILLALDSEPIRKTFDNLDDISSGENTNIRNLLNELYDNAGKKDITTSTYNKTMGKLFHYCVHVLQ